MQNINEGAVVELQYSRVNSVEAGYQIEGYSTPCSLRSIYAGFTSRHSFSLDPNERHSIC
jgi:hypothetical protein